MDKSVQNKSFLNCLSKILFYYTLYLTLIILSGLIEAQELAELNGTIFDQKTKKPLCNANVQILNTDFGGASNEQGFFKITNLPPGIYVLKISYMGYVPQSIKNIQLSPGEIQTIQILLVPTILKLKTVQIQENQYSEKYQTEVSRIGIQQIQGMRVKKIPGAFDDVIRSVHIFSNVMPASDYTSFFAVRGGSPDQNLVVMDGIEIPNPYRFRIAMGGGMSVFNPNVIENVNLHVGGFSSEYGNFLSSIMEVDMREGNYEQFQFGSSLNLLDVSCFFEGPLIKSKGSFLFAARRTFFDLVANRFSETNATYPYATDINTKITFHLTPQNKITLRTMFANENSQLSENMSDLINLNEDSRIELLSCTWRYKNLDKLLVYNTFSFYNEYFYFHLWDPNRTPTQTDENKFNSKVQSITFLSKIIGKFNKNIKYLCGFSINSFHPTVSYYAPAGGFTFVRQSLPPDIDFDKRINNTGFFLDNEIQFMDNIQTKIGMRYDYSTVNKEGKLSPRINVWLKMSSSLTMRIFYGHCIQYPNVLTLFNRDIPIKFDNINEIGSEKAIHYTIGITKKFKYGFTLDCDLYYKNLDHLIVPENYLNYSPTNKGNGVSKGIEFVLKKSSSANSPVSGIINYTYSFSQYHDNVHSSWIPFNFDRRYGLSTLLTIRLFKNFECNVLWRIGGGLPYNPVYGFQDAYSGDERKFLVNYANHRRFPTYERLDIRLSYHHQAGRKDFQMYIELINIYNKKNIYDQVWQLTESNPLNPDEKEAIVRSIYMLPFIPTIGISFKI